MDSIRTFGPDYYYFEPMPSPATTRAEVDFISWALDLRPGDLVLDIACGIGRHVAVLSERGYRAAGLDYSTYFLSIARQKLPPGSQRLIRADMRQLPLKSTLFDAVFIWQNSFNLFDNQDNLRVLQEVAKVLKPGGKLLLDVQNRDYVERLLPSVHRTEQETPDGLLITEEGFDRASKRSYYKAWLRGPAREKVYEYWWREYQYEELLALVVQAGLSPLRAFGAPFPNHPYTAQSAKIILVAHR